MNKNQVLKKRRRKIDKCRSEQIQEKKEEEGRKTTNNLLDCSATSAILFSILHRTLYFWTLLSNLEQGLRIKFKCRNKLKGSLYYFEPVKIE